MARVTLPPMPSGPPIYPVTADHTAELERALRICLAGMPVPHRLTSPGPGFDAWVQSKFLPVQGTHAIAVHRMALNGDSEGIMAADRSLALPGVSSLACRELLSRREGVRHQPVIRRLMAAVADDRIPGHFITVLAATAAEFSLGEVPMLQCALYCEWRSSRRDGTSAGASDFLLDTASLLPLCHPGDDPMAERSRLRAL